MKKIGFILEIVMFIFIDQITKYLVFINRYTLPKTIINNFFKINYCENRGIAFGIFSGKIVIVSIVTIIFLLSIIFVLKANFNKISKFSLFGIALVISGGIGNFIDRIFRGYVIDYISFTLFNREMAVFNAADIFITFGVILLMYIIIRDGKSERISSRRKR